MSNGNPASSSITVGHMLAAVTRAEHWLATLKSALVALPADMEVKLPSDSDAAKALGQLQPKYPGNC